MQQRRILLHSIGCSILEVLTRWWCRFTVELPPGLLQRNAELGSLPVPPDVQTKEQLEAIVKEARMPQAMVRGLYLFMSGLPGTHLTSICCTHNLILSCCRQLVLSKAGLRESVLGVSQAGFTFM